MFIFNIMNKQFRLWMTYLTVSLRFRLSIKPGTLDDLDIRPITADEARKNMVELECNLSTSFSVFWTLILKQI